MTKSTVAASVFTLAALVLLGKQDGRELSAREQASLVGGDDTNRYFNSCCVTSSACTLPSSTLCTGING